VKKTTIHQIAKALGIDSSTVSRALNDSDRVKQKTKESVLQKAEELGYTRNILASNLRRNKSNTIGVVVPRISRYFFSSTIAGIEEVAYKSGYNVIICQSLEQLERERKIIENLILNRVDGVLISVSMETENGPHLAECMEKGTPLVFFDRHVQALENTGKVLIDDTLGGFEATEHLIRKGCRKIAHFSGPQQLEIYKNRLRGYKLALEKYNFPYQEDLIFTSRLMESDGREMARMILEGPEEVDGIFSANDVAAIGAMKYLKSAGKHIPGDIAIVGFSNEPTSEVIEPSLTTVDQSGERIGKLACSLLLNKISKKDTLVEDKTIILNPKLIERDSTKKLQNTSPAGTEAEKIDTD
jgi:LacI family transcriptional regulator